MSNFLNIFGINLQILKLDEVARVVAQEKEQTHGTRLKDVAGVRANKRLAKETLQASLKTNMADTM